MKTLRSKEIKKNIIKAWSDERKAEKLKLIGENVNNSSVQKWKQYEYQQ